MSAAQALRETLYRRANGKCECTMRACSHHTGKCTAILRGAWEVHRLNAGGAYTATNCLAMCQTCHRNTPSYGRG